VSSSGNVTSSTNRVLRPQQMRAEACSDVRGYLWSALFGGYFELSHLGERRVAVSTVSAVLVVPRTPVAEWHLVGTLKRARLCLETAQVV
jgi:hypothetical protein